MQENKYDNEAIGRFVANKSSYTEAEEIADYLTSNGPLLAEILPFDETTPVFSFEEKRKQLQKIIGRPVGRVINLPGMVAAAAVIGIVAVTLLWWVQQRPAQPTKPKIADIQSVIKKNTSDKPLKMLLPDGSSATLGPGAEIVYGLQFAEARNIAQASGDVFFDVKKDSTHPFTVQARGIQTTVLGTRFWIELPKNTSMVAVKLQSGKVKLQSVDKNFAMNETFLSPGENCYINKATGTLQVSPATITANPLPKAAKNLAQADKKAVVWTNENMQFSKAGLGSVFEKLEARYQVKIIAEEGIVNGSVLTGKIYHTDSLQAIIKSISDINKLSFEIRNDSVFLYKKPVE